MSIFRALWRFFFAREHDMTAATGLTIHSLRQVLGEDGASVIQPAVPLTEELYPARATEVCPCGALFVPIYGSGGRCAVCRGLCRRCGAWFDRTPQQGVPVERGGVCPDCETKRQPADVLPMRSTRRRT